MYLALILILSLNTQLSWSQEFDQICKPQMCTNETMTSKYVLSYCHHQNGTINNRCCLTTFNSSSFISGIDYSNCDLNSLDLQTNLTDQIRSNISILDLTGFNSKKLCTNSAYAGFINLDELYLPNGCECPGGNYSWSSYSNNTCLNQMNICESEFPRVNCTVNSVCGVNGPGNFLCSCKENFHGYKCLNEGKFPTLVFTAVLCGCTLLLSALLWHFQRRHVKFD